MTAIKIAVPEPDQTRGIYLIIYNVIILKWRRE